MSTAPQSLLRSFSSELFDAPSPRSAPAERPREEAPGVAVGGKPLEDLNFSDLYINLGNPDEEAHYRIGPNTEGLSGLSKVPPSYDAQIGYLRNQIAKQQRDSDILTMGGMRLRFMRARMADGYERAAVRNIPLVVPKLDEISLSPEGAKALRGWGRSRGIIAIGGPTGNGKTTTAVAMLHEYLNKLGGKAITIEDPPEYLLQGWIGENGGNCDQIHIESDDGWKEAVNVALRWRPRYILFGEVRTPQAAGQALRASTSGHLVIATVHGGSVEESLGALLRLAEVDMGEGARKLLAGNLTGVVQQRLGRHGPDLDILAIPRGKSEEAQIRKHLSDGGASNLSGYVKAYPAARD